MPSVHRKSLLCVIQSVGLYYLKSRIRCAKFSVLPSDIKIPRSAEIVLRSRRANCGVNRIAVNIKLHFPLAPPVIVIHTPKHIRSHIMTVTAYIIQNSIALLVRKRIDTAKLRMKISAVLRKLSQSIINLIPNRNAFVMLIFKRYPAFFIKRHIPVAIKSLFRVYAYGKRGKL